MEFTDDGVVVEKPPNELDELVLDVTSILDDIGVQYVVVSGYIAVLFGRARATEDVDVIVEPFDEETGTALAEALSTGGYWGFAMSLEELHETLADDLPVRIAEEGHRVPNVEVKFASDEYDRISLENAITVELPEGAIRTGPLEFQIAYKLDMGAQKDFEDALYLYEIARGNLNTPELESYVESLGVEAAYEELTS